MGIFRDNFKGRRYAVAARAPGDIGPRLKHGEITAFSAGKFRCDVRVDGYVQESVRLPGPFYTKLGFLAGIKQAYHVGQRVLLAVPEGAASPVIVSVSPFPGGNLSKENLENSAAYVPEVPEIGHESGWRMSFKSNELVIYDSNDVKRASFELQSDAWTLKDKNGNERIKIDMVAKEIVFKGFSLFRFEKENGSDAYEISEGDSTALADNPSLSVTQTTHVHPTAVPGAPSPPTGGT